MLSSTSLQTKQVVVCKPLRKLNNNNDSQVVLALEVDHPLRTAVDLMKSNKSRIGSKSKTTNKATSCIEL